MGWQQIQARDQAMRPIALRLAGTDDLTRAMAMVNTESRFAFRTTLRSATGTPPSPERC